MPISRQSGSKLRLQLAILALSLALLAAFLLIPALLPFFLALGLAYAFSPWVDKLQAKGLNRSLGALGLLAGLLLVAVLAAVFVLPGLVREAKDFVASLPDNLAAALVQARHFGRQFGVELPEGQALVVALREKLQASTAYSMSSGLDLAKGLAASLGNAFVLFMGFLLAPIFFYFLLRDWPDIKAHALGLVPPRYQGLALRGHAQVDKVCSSYIRGQLILACILGAGLAGGLLLLGVRFGLVIGLLAGFLNLIPYVGQIVGVLLALTMGLVDFQDWPHLLGIPILFAGMNMLEGNFITPKVVGERVGLSSVETLLALVLGAELAGLSGLVIVVPVAGVLKLLLLDWVEDYKASKHYLGGPRPGQGNKSRPRGIQK